MKLLRLRNVTEKMALRRNIVSLLIWLGAAIIFTLHVIMQHSTNKNQVKRVNKRKITEVKTTILKRTELENVHRIEREYEDYNKKSNSKIEDENHDHRSKSLDKSEREDAMGKQNNYEQEEEGSGSVSVDLQSYLEKVEKLEKELEKMKAENSRLIEREHRFKNLNKKLEKVRKVGLLPHFDPFLPWIFAITPTYVRFTQKADLVRLVQTLLHVTNLHWILVEDSAHATSLVSRLLQESHISFTHLNMLTPPTMQRKKGEKHNKHHRGVAQRNLGLKWLRNNVDPQKTPGAVYFMDDDNTYHRNIFNEMRRTRRVSVWPVGLAGGAKWSGPIVSNGKVVRFHTNWAPGRSFPIDMAGFAISLNLLLKENPLVKFDMNAKRGYLEPTFLEVLTTMDQLEPLADNCTKIYVWHTRTEVPRESIRGEKMLLKLGTPSDPAVEV